LIAYLEIVKKRSRCVDEIIEDLALRKYAMDCTTGLPNVWDKPPVMRSEGARLLLVGLHPIVIRFYSTHLLSSG